MAYYCYKCRNELDFIIKVGIKVGRQDHCKHCGTDLHVCRNCHFYDPGSHNQCRENQAEFIRDREAANFCAHFTFIQLESAPEVDDSQAQARSKLDALFKDLK